jgi:hypothetical protein
MVTLARYVERFLSERHALIYSTQRQTRHSCVSPRDDSWVGPAEWVLVGTRGLIVQPAGRFCLPPRSFVFANSKVCDALHYQKMSASLRP